LDCGSGETWEGYLSRNSQILPMSILT
jgi:hypothetical protein